MKHTIEVTFHTHGQQADAGRAFVEDAIRKHPNVHVINTLKVRSNEKKNDT